MTMNVAINGFGRMGRNILRRVIDRVEDDIQVVAINDLTAPAVLANLLRYDSTYGPWGSEVGSGDTWISVDGRVIQVSAEPDPELLPWRALGVDLVIEASGRFRTRDAAAAHLRAGASKVVVTAPGKQVDATIVLGVNEDTYRPDAHHVVSNASCTTNCLAPMLAVLDAAFGVRRGLMTTIHSYTNDQSLLDSPHKDARRARSAAVNIIPTSTGAAAAVGEVLPRLRGKLDGVAVRVPVEDGSLTDLCVELDVAVTAAEVNQAFAEAAEGHLKSILRYTEDPIVSRDIIGDPASCVFDASLTRVSDNLVKVFGWYDNEWGYANRTVELVALMAGSR
ncbi:type I glyceraldehyde-3-phosphate dehydrogenase [Actinokineospora xionganensis]|uniref:Glyceraldehyde-3-phosphate dehydrogenase n=1 Tax=Actinokineospora xionganensis TaxID=2684470 RepID=A0ABR7KZM1_9PSEU|nr:type I glyceraldehyde-3-phosphate dehydrogenase [Actinokineospora xionganensis]MBC6445874.1 type I glyceraldehyde-3-phosphate dehydrogenase [Actinokineospora xionganensis]